MLSQDLDPDTLVFVVQGRATDTLILETISKEDDAADNAESNHHAYNEITKIIFFQLFIMGIANKSTEDFLFHMRPKYLGPDTPNFMSLRRDF